MDDDQLLRFRTRARRVLAGDSLHYLENLAVCTRIDQAIEANAAYLKSADFQSAESDFRTQFSAPLLQLREEHEQFEEEVLFIQELRRAKILSDEMLPFAVELARSRFLKRLRDSRLDLWATAEEMGDFLCVASAFLPVKPVRREDVIELIDSLDDPDRSNIPEKLANALGSRWGDTKPNTLRSWETSFRYIQSGELRITEVHKLFEKADRDEVRLKSHYFSKTLKAAIQLIRQSEDVL